METTKLDAWSNSVESEMCPGSSKCPSALLVSCELQTAGRAGPGRAFAACLRLHLELPCV